MKKEKKNPGQRTHDILQEYKRYLPLSAELDKVRALDGPLGEEDAVVGNDADGIAVNAGEARNQGLAVQRLELAEDRAVDDPGDHLAHVVRLLQVRPDNAVELVERVLRQLDFALDRRGDGATPVQVRDDLARQVQRVRVVLGQVVHHAGFPAQCLCGEDFFAPSSNCSLERT